jgi:hypothetical protein
LSGADGFDEASERGGATSADAGEEGSFRGDALARGGVIEEGQGFERGSVRGSALDGEGALSGRGEEVRRYEWNGFEIGQVGVESLEACFGEDKGVVVGTAKFFEPGGDVAADVAGDGPRGEAEELESAAVGAGSDAGVGGKTQRGVGGFDDVGADEEQIAGGGAPGVGRDGEFSGGCSGEILQAVDGEVGGVGDEGEFDVAGEESGAFGFSKGLVGNPVTVGLDNEKFAVDVALALEGVGDEAGLDQGEVRASGGDA